MAQGLLWGDIVWKVAAGRKRRVSATPARGPAAQTSANSRTAHAHSSGQPSAPEEAGSTVWRDQGRLHRLRQLGDGDGWPGAVCPPPAAHVPPGRASGTAHSPSGSALSAPAVCEASPLLPRAHVQIRTPARTPSVGAPPAPAHRARHAPADTAATREHVPPCGSPGRAREVIVPLVGPTSRPEGAERLPPFVPQGWRPSHVRQRAAHTPPAERPRLPSGPERALTCADPSGPPSG